MTENVQIKMNNCCKRVILAGMMGSGKTTVGKLLADYLNWNFIDTDTLIEQRSGTIIRELFAQKGESFFRNMERELVQELQDRDHCVIATGGGMVVDEKNRQLLSSESLVVHLYASVQALTERLNYVTDRPLLLKGERQQELKNIYSERKDVYTGLPIQIMTDNKSPIQCAQQILAKLIQSDEELWANRFIVHLGCPLISKLEQIVRNSDISSPLILLVDEGFARGPGYDMIEDIKYSLKDKFKLVTIFLKSHEESKSIESAIDLWKMLIENNAERSSGLIVIGGGVLGDVGGFVASTYMRGMHLIQVPTTLLAQIDSSLGGKTGINLHNTKNMVGTFYPADHTILDPLLLLTLPEREMRSGMAEMIKAALLGDKEFFEFLELNMKAVLQCQIQPIFQSVAQAARIKLEIVEKDLREQSGYRRLLNLGHTFGHAIEAESRYRYRHGEAVAIGLVLATNLAVKMKRCEMETLERLVSLLQRANLPVEMPTVSNDAILEKIKRDKKHAQQILHFVMPTSIGRAEVVPIPDETQLRLAFDF